ncbi:MAG: hypothetical protein ACOCVF_03585 [bacterium]
MAMNNSSNNNINIKRYNIFKKHIKLLIEKSQYFSMRHKNDIVKLIEDIGEEYKDKITFQFCPTIEYTLNKNIESTGNYIAFEIKDDRLWRRLYRIGRDKYYFELEKTINILLNKGESVAFLSHDGSKLFYNYLLKRGLKIEFIDNSVSDETVIYNNYSKIKTLICTAGHSQMIGSVIRGMKIISLVTHPKILNFCLDTNNNNYVEPNKDFNFSNKLINMI